MQNPLEALILDTETTGIEEPQEIQVAFIPLSIDRVLHAQSCGEHFNEYYMPAKPISLGALAVHHIFEDDLEGCEPSGTFRESYLNGHTTYITGHNIDFDWRVLKEPNVKRICTLALSRFLFPDLDSHSLSAMMYFAFGKGIKDELRNAHNAYADIGLNLKLFNFLLAAAQDKEYEIGSWEDIWELSELARIPTKMAFGKHKGKPIGAVDFGYVSWYRKQPDCDPYLLEAFSRAHGR